MKQSCSSRCNRDGLTPREHHSTLLERQTRSHQNTVESIQLECDNKLKTLEKRLESSQSTQELLKQDVKALETKIKSVETEKRQAGHEINRKKYGILSTR